MISQIPLLFPSLQEHGGFGGGQHGSHGGQHGSGGGQGGGQECCGGQGGGQHFCFLSNCSPIRKTSILFFIIICRFCLKR